MFLTFCVDQLPVCFVLRRMLYDPEVKLAAHFNCVTLIKVDRDCLLQNLSGELIFYASVAYSE
jgi:hypothetical protein